MTVRQGRTIVPAGLVLVVALLGAGGVAGAPPADGDGLEWMNRHFGHPIAPIYLLLRPDVQADLQFNPRQIAGARELVGQIVERLLSAKDRSGKVGMKDMQDVDAMMAAWLRRELSEVQLDRLTQISLQWEGVSALRRPSIVEHLGMVEAQQLKVRQLLTDRDGRQTAGSLAPGEFDRLSREALDVLNPLQKQQWNVLLGTPCRFVLGPHPAAPGRAPAAVGRPPGSAPP